MDLAVFSDGCIHGQYTCETNDRGSSILRTLLALSGVHDIDSYEILVTDLGNCLQLPSCLCSLSIVKPIRVTLFPTILPFVLSLCCFIMRLTVIKQRVLARFRRTTSGKVGRDDG